MSKGGAEVKSLIEIIEDGGTVSHSTTKCEDCGATLRVGDWPFCGGKNDHGRPYKHKGFDPHWDNLIDAKPQWIQTPGDRHKFLKPHWENDHIVHQQPRDKSNDYWKDLNNRREARRLEAERNRR